MLDQYMCMEVTGVYVYMFHENLSTLRPYIESDDRINSYIELLEYCNLHGIKIEFEPPVKGNERTYRKMRRLLEKYPKIIMSENEVNNLIEAFSQA